ncbi:hypothetical protein [Fastidiosibacter lacustris]|uniref:hypothetical protein n=1 Tax=Fastidiosibacter lacustris TaxID=2056695 RepID=UPI000E34445B|nr:hypothetical protein [Fastidiosibacter lacustris]
MKPIKELLSIPSELSYHELLERWREPLELWGFSDNNAKAKYIAQLINKHGLKAFLTPSYDGKEYISISIKLGSQAINYSELSIKIIKHALSNLALVKSLPVKGYKINRFKFIESEAWRNLFLRSITTVLFPIDDDIVDKIGNKTRGEILSIISNGTYCTVLLNHPLELKTVLVQDYNGYLQLQVGDVVGADYIITTYKWKDVMDDDCIVAIYKELWNPVLLEPKIEAPVFKESQLYFKGEDIIAFEEAQIRQKESNKRENNNKDKSSKEKAPEPTSNGVLKCVQKQRELALQTAINLGAIKKSHTKAEIHKILKQASPELFTIARTTFNDFFKKQQLFNLNSGRRSMEDITEKC